jgi:phosphatidylinositol alpha-1,6-mannosyltransferase
VINSLPEVTKHEPDLIYLIVGDGQEMINLQQLVKEKNLTDHVIFTGAQDINEVAYFFSLANAFIMITRPSVSGDVESFGMVYLEAGQFGLPVIASNVGGVSETVIANQTGFLLNDISEKAVGKAIIRLFSDPDLMNKFGVQGRKRVNELFSWGKQAEKLEKILKYKN